MQKIISRLIQVGTVILGWALTPVIGEYLVDRTGQLTPLQLSFFRYFFASLVLFILLLFNTKNVFKKILESFRNKWKIYLLASAICAGMPVLLFFSVKWTSASSASFLLNSNIILIPIFAFLFIREKISKWQAIGIIISFLGLFLVIFDKDLLTLFQLSKLNMLGNLLAFSSGIFWALYTIILKKYFSDENPLLVTFLNLFIGSIFLAGFAFSIDLDYLQVNLSGWFLILLIAIVSTSLAYTFWLTLLKGISSTKTGIIQAFVPIVSVILAIIFLDESITYIFGIGAILIAGGIFFVERNFKEKGVS